MKCFSLGSVGINLFRSSLAQQVHLAVCFGGIVVPKALLPQKFGLEGEKKNSFL